MNAFNAVFKRELKAYFGTPLAYVFLALFLLVASGWMFMTDFFLRQDASLTPFFEKLPWLFSFFAPLIAMGMWAEERRTGSIEMLLTLPLTTRQAVLGKFMAGWAFMAIALLLTMPVLFTIQYLGDPELGPVFTGYLGSLLLGGCCLAVSSFFSVLTKSQVISCVLAVMACILFNIFANPAVRAWFPEAFSGLSLAVHFDVMQRGIVELRNVLFMFIVGAGFLVASVVMLEDRKAA